MADCDSDSHHLKSRLIEPNATARQARNSVSLLWVVAALLIVQAAFGGNAVITKIALARHDDPVVFSFLRDVGGALVLLASGRICGCLVWPRRTDLGMFIVLGILGVYIAQMFLVLALQLLDPLHCMLVQPMQPVLTTLLAAAFGVEPLQLRRTHGRLKMGGVLLAAAGALCTVYYAGTSNKHARAADIAEPSPSTPASQTVTGFALLAAQCVAGALYQLVQKHLLSTADYPPLAVAAMGYLVGSAAIGLMLPVCKLDPESWSFVHDPTAMAALAYAVFITSALNYGLLAFANKNSSPTLVTAFFPLQVVFTALISWLALGSKPRPSDCAGGAMIVGGLACVTAGRVRHTSQASKRVDGID